MIDDSTLVTAAHNLYEPKDGSYACGVTIYIGVTDGDKDDGRIVEKGLGKAITIHWEYYAAARDPNDMAMIKLEEPLKLAGPIPWITAPLTARDDFIRVVGYPADLPEEGSDKGSVMYMSEGPVTYDLEEDGYLLNYKVDTFGGQSMASCTTMSCEV